MARPPREITQLLNTSDAVSAGAADRLWSAVYPELRRRAGAMFRDERSGHTLSATGVVNEAYLRLATHEPKEWKNRSHFYAVASEIMRQVLIDHARKRAAAKRGGGATRQPLEEELFPSMQADAEGLRAAEQALEMLASRNSRAALVVAMRVFGGLTVAEVARELDVSPRTVKADWLVAKMRLGIVLGARPASPP